MTAKFQILVPEATTNIIRNPSAEVNLNDWLADGSVIARTNEEARFGFASVQVTTNGAALYEGVLVRSFPNTIDTIYAGSAYVKGSGQVRVRMRDETNGNEYISDDVTLNANRWVRISDVVGRTGPANCDNLALHIETTGRIQATTFYVDGVDITPGAYSTTHVDGEQEGCEWEGTYHASISLRNAYERSGGRFLDLDEDGIGVYATGISGVGMPPLRHNLLDRALIPGLEFQSTKVQARAINITLFARAKKLKNMMTLHEKRSELINAIKPDIVSPTQPFILRYNGGSFPIDIPVNYEAGLEFEGDIRNENYNSFMMRLLATDPFWIEDNRQTELLDFSDSFNAPNLVARINGRWQTPYDIAPNDWIYSIVQAPNGDIYIGGVFTTIDGIASQRIARYDGENWYPVANGVNAAVYAIVPAPDGTVYVLGSFTADGPGLVPLNRVARYDPVTDTLAQVGAGLNNQVRGGAIHPITGNLYVGGLFNDVNGGVGNSLNHIAMWNINNLTWNAIGTGPGLNDNVYALLYSDDGEILYVGGNFSEEGAAAGAFPGTYGGVARYYPDTDAFYTMGTSGMGDTSGFSLAKGMNGLIYLGGTYETIEGMTAKGAARWNSTAWNIMSGGVSYNPPGDVFVGGCRVIAVDPDENIILGGGFEYAGELFTGQGIAFWNGTSYVRIDAQFPRDAIGLSADIFSLLSTRYGDLWVGSVIVGAIGDIIVSAITEINNMGSSNAYPILEVVGPGRMFWLENQTIGKTMYLDLTVHDGETVIIDLENNTLTSDWSGNRLGDVLPESDVADWFLAPGVNRIAAFIIDDDPDTSLTMTWKPRHWSVDGAVE